MSRCRADMQLCSANAVVTLRRCHVITFRCDNTFAILLLMSIFAFTFAILLLMSVKIRVATVAEDSCFKCCQDSRRKCCGTKSLSQMLFEEIFVANVAEDSCFKCWTDDGNFSEGKIGRSWSYPSARSGVESEGTVSLLDTSRSVWLCWRTWPRVRAAWTTTCSACPVGVSASRQLAGYLLRRGWLHLAAPGLDTS